MLQSEDTACVLHWLAVSFAIRAQWGATVTGYEQSLFEDSDASVTATPPTQRHFTPPTPRHPHDITDILLLTYTGQYFVYGLVRTDAYLMVLRKCD